MLFYSTHSLFVYKSALGIFCCFQSHFILEPELPEESLLDENQSQVSNEENEEKVDDNNNEELPPLVNRDQLKKTV